MRHSNIFFRSNLIFDFVSKNEPKDSKRGDLNCKTKQNEINKKETNNLTWFAPKKSNNVEC